MPTETTYRIIQEWFGAIGRGDLEFVLQTLAEDVVFTLPKDKADAIIPYLGRRVGRAAVAEAFRIREETTETLEYTTRNLIAQDQQACAIIYTKGRYRGSGVEYEIEDAHWFLVDETGKIKRWTVYFNPGPEVLAFQADTGRQILAALRAGDVERVGTLCDVGADPDTRDPETGLTLLMMAAGRANAAMVKLLLDKGADAFAVDSQAGASAMHKACQGGSLDVVKLLVEAGAFVDWVAPTTGHTPLMDALWFKYLDIVQYLLDHNAGLNTYARYGFSLQEHLDFELKVTASDKGPLEEAARLVQQRREQDARKVASQKLMEAVTRGDLRAVRQQIAAGADVDERSPVLNQFNDAHTPLLVAARDGHREIVAELLAAGADVNAVEPTFLAVPLHKAVYNGHVEITRLLVAHPRIDLDFPGATNGYTPLHDALWHGDAACARVLVEAGARLDIEGHDGKLPADLAREKLGPDHELTRLIASQTPPR